MEAFVCTFQIELTSPTLSETSSASSSVFSGTKLLFHTVADPGSFQADSTGSKFLLRWDHWADFQAWLENEEHHHCIELRLVQTTKGLPQFDKKLRYVCSQHGTGSVKVYEKKFPERLKGFLQNEPGAPVLSSSSNTRGHASYSAHTRKCITIPS
jgi:hypothetical protein